MKRLTIWTTAYLALGASAFAQTSPNLSYGQVLTAGQWNALLAGKQDYLGSPPLPTAGGTMTGELITAPSTSLRSGFNIPAGVAPTSPINGDMWSTSAGFFGRVSGVTVGPFASSTSGTFTATSPLAVTFPGGGVVNYAINYNSTFLLNAGVLGVNLGNPNTWTGVQTFVAPVLGAASTLLYSLPEQALAIVLSLFAGFFLYIGASDLIPESHHAHPKFLTTAMTLLGVAVLFMAIKLANI